MRYPLVAIAAAAMAVAQSNSTEGGVLVPSNITSACSSFLSTLNADSTLSSCVTPLINATASFSPTAAANLTNDTINWTLASICKTNTGCSDSTIRGWLARFYSECYPELTSSTEYNSDVRELYDILYVINPLKGAVCSIDSASQEYCVHEIVSAEAASSNSTGNSTTSGNGTTLLSSFAAGDYFSPIQVAAANLYIEVSVSASGLKKRFLDSVFARRDPAQSVMAAIITPNATTYKTTNLPFLFLQSSMHSKALCTPCTKEVMVSYIKWETQVPYALGLKQSPILGGQSELWSAINNTCGASYINAINSQVGSLISNSSSAGESVFVGQSGVAGMTALIGATLAAGVVALFI
ncbi:uncharacterized protein L203_103181 [Cryptococcus depauperatus CBS 7841]|uniref:DUF7729 domain-containing protein n=1 Tax=Cryptococcus depauperatus CBS 7841 TaxID=1295531 RepID=A0A1E3IPA0_9TREE|nr:hypothetical protein L203_01542 [Cryptococcus depauperatus CBS 7841]